MVYELGKRGSLHVEHPQITYGELVDLSSVYGIERSDHIGNLHASALLTVTDPNVKGSQLLVDSNNGDDREYFPRHLIYGEEKIPMAPASKGTMVVRCLTADLGKQNKKPLAKLTDELGSNPLEQGDSLAQFHLAHLKGVSRGTEILTNADLMARNPEAVVAMAGYLASYNALRRVVGEDGRIVERESSQQDVHEQGIYGLEDITPIERGVMIPLPGILALDIVDNAARGVDRIYHQAGCDMRRYTYDRELMQLVAGVAAAGLDAIQAKEVPLYAVLDTANLENIVQTIECEGVRSQYDAHALQMNGGTFQVDPSYYDMPIWML